MLTKLLKENPLEEDGLPTSILAERRGSHTMFWVALLAVCALLGGLGISNGDASLLAVLPLLPLLAIYFALTAAIRCGRLRRRLDWTLVNTTPFKLEDIFLFRMRPLVKELLFVALSSAVLLGMYAMLTIKSPPPDWGDLVGGLLVLMLWAHAVLFLLGSTLSAGAFGLNRKTLSGCIWAGIGALILHAAIMGLTLLLPGVMLVVGFCYSFGCSYSGTYPDWIDWGMAILSLISVGLHWLALRIGPRHVGSVDRSREGLRMH